MASELFLSAWKKCCDAVRRSPSERSSRDIQLLSRWLTEKGNIFKRLSEDDMQALAKVVYLKEYEPEAVIFEQGERINSFFVILRGSVTMLMNQMDSFNTYTRQSALSLRDTGVLDQLLQVDKSGEVLNPTMSEVRRTYGTELRTLFPGDHFGEVGLLLTHSLSPSTAICDEPCQVLTIDKEAFHKYIAAHLQHTLLQRAFFIASCPIFESWTPLFVRQLCTSLYETRLKFEDVVFQEGEGLKYLYIIKSGSVMLSVTSGKSDLVNKIESQLDGALRALERVTEKLDSSTDLHVTNTRPAKAAMLVPWSSSFTTPKTSLRKLSPKIGFRLRTAPITSSVPVCTLGPGDFLGNIEAMCQLKCMAFTAVTMGRATVYELDIHHFNYLMANKHPQTLHKMATQLFERVAGWESRLSCLPLLGILRKALGQVCSNLEARGVHRKRKVALYPPDAVAMAAIKIPAGRMVRDFMQQDSSEFLAPPKAKSRLHPFDSPPPQLYHPVTSNLEPLTPCSHELKESSGIMIHNKNNLSHLSKSCTGNEVMLFDLESMTAEEQRDINTTPVEPNNKLVVKEISTLHSWGLNVLLTRESLLSAEQYHVEQGPLLAKSHHFSPIAGGTVMLGKDHQVKLKVGDEQLAISSGETLTKTKNENEQLELPPLHFMLSETSTQPAKSLQQPSIAKQSVHSLTATTLPGVVLHQPSTVTYRHSLNHSPVTTMQESVSSKLPSVSSSAQPLLVIADSPSILQPSSSPPTQVVGCSLVQPVMFAVHGSTDAGVHTARIQEQSKITSQQTSNVRQLSTSTDSLRAPLDEKSTSLLADQPKSTFLLADQPKSTFLLADQPKSTSLLADQPKSTFLLADQPKSTSLLADQPKSNRQSQLMDNIQPMDAETVVSDHLREVKEQIPLSSPQRPQELTSLPQRPIARDDSTHDVCDRPLSTSHSEADCSSVTLCQSADEMTTDSRPSSAWDVPIKILPGRVQLPIGAFSKDSDGDTTTSLEQRPRQTRRRQKSVVKTATSVPQMCAASSSSRMKQRPLRLQARRSVINMAFEQPQTQPESTAAAMVKTNGSAVRHQNSASSLSASTCVVKRASAPDSMGNP